MLHSNANRVKEQTAPHINQAIEQKSRDRVQLYSAHAPDLITKRLQRLDAEWDTERTLQTNFATLSLVGIALAATVDKRWALLAIGVPAFMIQHALQGWCPPLAVLRRKGFRTTKEINEERFALKSLRGDFADVRSTNDPKDILDAVRS
ncbi:hypothetical protein [Marinobacter salicampi]|uniref:hypothetical protein n=1 Tax=Marinobacter salicampi TaxID=435907 RepID=UPI00140828CC|nr:hypothetical protein [Marinobacter salicampi]